MTETNIFHAGSAQATTDKAQRAVKAFRSLQPTLTAYARMLSRNPSIRVELSATSNGHTDGKKIYYRPPIALGDNAQHVRSHCDKRDETKQLLCKACAVREDVLVTIYHEIAHICFQSLTTVDEYALAGALKKAVEAHGEGYGKLLAERIQNTPIYQRDQYIKLARLVSPFMPLIVNALEDARVNNRLYEARQGTRVMFEAMIYRVLTEGVEQVNPETGLPEFVKWNQYPLNPQVIVACLVVAQGYNLEGAFAPQVRLATEDVVVRRILRSVKTARSVQAVYGISFDLLIRLRELGFCLSDMDPQPEPEPEPEPEEEPQDEPKPEDAEPEEAGEAEEGESGGEGESGEVGGGESPESTPESHDDGSDDCDAEAVDSGTDGGDPEEDEGSESDGGTGESGSEAEGAPEDQHSDGPGDDSPATTGQSSMDGLDGADAEEGDCNWDGDSEPGESDEDCSESQPDPSDDGGQAADEGEHPDSGASDKGEAKQGSADDGDEVGGDADGDVSDPAGDSTSGGDEGGEDLDETTGEADGESGGAGTPGDDTEGADGGSQGAHSGAGDVDGDDAQDFAGRDADAEVQPEGSARDSEPTPDEPGSDLHPEGDMSTDGEDGEADAAEVKAFESGADEGKGGVNLIEDESNDDIPFGDEKDVEAVLHQWEGHDTPDEIREEADVAEDRAMETAVVQGIYFETPSRNVTGVREHQPGGGLVESQYRNAWNYPGFDEDDKRYFGITGEFDPEERELGPALLRMRVALSNNQRGSERRHLKSGKVNSRVLGRRAHLGDERLFQKRSMPGKRDYFVLIGMDVSASTAGDNLTLEKQAVMAQANLLNRLGVDFAIYAHSCGWTDRDDGRAGGVSLDIYRVKDVNEPFNEAARDRIRTLGPDSGNIDGHTLEFYRKVLDRSTATDRIIMYYTDGKMPAENHDEELMILQREIKTCKRKGYTLMGVGIRTDSPVRHGLDTVQIDTHTDVVKVVKHLEKRLTSK